MVEVRHLELVERLTGAFADEIDRHDRAAPVPWPWWPDVASLIGHLGGIHAWAAQVVRTGQPVPDPEDLPAPPRARDWYRDRRSELLDALGAAPASRPCWVFTGEDRTVGFWRRRMVFETAKHLIDLRAAGGARRSPPPELDVVAFADGLDELFSVFLRRSRGDLDPLPASVRLVATDSDRAWMIAPDWTLGTVAGPYAEIRAGTGDLALLGWQRADPLAEPDRFDLTGSVDAVIAFRDAAIHP